MRYFLEFSYKGTNYHGWQIQPNAITVQEILEKKMSTLLGEKISVTAAGRTDTGVHAKKMYAHFDYDNLDKNKFIYRLNSFLPKDIAIHDLIHVKTDAHARFDAVSRKYLYYIHHKKNPFLEEVSWHWKFKELDIDKMNLAAAKLLDFNDFTSFAKLHTDNKTNICKVEKAKWTKQKDQYIFEIEADRFLRNMVRSIVGTLVEIGNNKLSHEDIIEIIEKKDRKFASASAPASGLFLAEVVYPNSIYER